MKRIEKITVKEITERAGYNRSTFYEYFTDVYDVLEKLEDSLQPDFKEMPSLLPVFGEAPIEVGAFINLYSASSKYYSVLLGDNGDPSFVGKIKKSIKSKILEQSNENGINPEMDYYLEYMLSALVGILTYWFNNEENISQEKLVKIIYEMMSGEGVKNLANNIERL